MHIIFELHSVRKHRLEAMHQLLKDKKTCDHCNSEMPKFTKIDLHVMVVFPDGMGIFPENGDKKQYLPAAKVVEIFKRMRDEDIKAVGLDITWARPEWLLVSVLPVPPIHMRPSLFFSGGVLHSEDDLTHQIVNIVKSNIALKNSITHGEPNMIVEQFEESLQYNVAAYMDNEMKGLPQVTQRSGRPLKTLKQRLQGKEGRIRGNLMGKRVDFSARAVITPDPHLGIEQVGVPKSVAMNLTVSEHVTPLNILQLSKLVAKGPMVHPGAKYIIQKDGTRIDLRYIKDKANLQLAIGWIVERHLHDNDIVVFNRQPSLHKMSIMGHRVKVLDGSTFRLNLSCTSPYNADFDGDEMNLHVPQSLPARVEAEQLMLSSKLVVSGQSNKPVMGVVQDALLAVQKMTKRDVFIERDLFFNLLMWVHDWDGCIPPPAILKPKQLWTGKQVMSLILPKINLKGLANKNSSEDILQHLLNPYDKRVTVIDGVLVEGIIDKKTIGCCMGGLIHTTWLDLGCEANAKFMNQIQDVVNYWILHSSFSVGVIDTILDMDTANKISNTIDKAKKDVQNLLDKGNQRELEAQPGRTVMESFEQYVNKILNAARDHAGMTAQEAFTEKNALKAMVIAGSKGSSINISQIVACVGQQSIEGNRIPCGFHRRSLPHFSKYDLRPESRGFVENAYITGLTPHEFFFHAMAGRECLIDTACKTADTGYVQRRLVKALETAICCYDGTVRTSDGKLVQFLYGEVSCSMLHF
jgi:DNA-directed RNA polymerase II subunit RPB1